MSNRTKLPGCGLLAVLSLACANAAGAPPVPRDAPIDGAVIAAGYLSHHPDLRHRIEGMRALDDGFPKQAMTAFRRAARYADKPAQAMLAHLYWTGTGTPVDRPRGYAWMDIAAQRGYPGFIGWRERYWAALSPAERREAVTIGRPLMDTYGDASAKPRLERVMRRGLRQQAGSRVGGSAIGMTIKLVGPTAGGSTSSYVAEALGMTIDGNDYYQRKYWHPRAYWEWQDRQWGVDPSGTVVVQSVQRVEDGT